MGPDGAAQRGRPEGLAAERILSIIRFLEWLRHAPVQSEARASAPAELGAAASSDATPTQALRLRHMLGVIERNAEHRDRVGAMLVAFLREVDSAALLADFGFAPRAGLWAEFGRRVRARILPLTPATTDLGELFALLFPPGSDVTWLSQLDAETEARLVALLAPLADDGSDWRVPFFEAIMFLASAIRSAGFSPLLRQRISPELLVDEPFRQLARAAELIREHAESNEPDAHDCCATPSTCAPCSMSAGAARQACTSTSKRTASRSTSSSRPTSCASARTGSSSCSAAC